MAAYVSVTWTTGDVITETKLDNMVSNDQSEDAHAGNGLVLNNNVAYQGKNSGGTAKDLIKLDTDDILRLSQIRTQTDDSDSIASATSEDVMIQSGYGQMVGDDTDTISEIVNFPTAFTTVISVIASTLSSKSSSAATDITDLTSGYGAVVASAHVDDVTTSSFTIGLTRETGNYSSSNYYGYSWIAIGTK